MDVPPKTGLRNRLNQGTKLRGEAKDDGKDGGNWEKQRGVNARGGHHTNVFTVGRHAGTTEETREHRGDTITQEGTTHVGVKVTTRHGGHGLDVAQVFSDQNHDHRDDQGNGVHIEDRCVNRRDRTKRRWR